MARLMLSFFSEQRDRIPLRDVEEYFPGAPREDLCEGIRLGVQHAVFFLGLRRIDLEPLLGVFAGLLLRRADLEGPQKLRTLLIAGAIASGV